MWFLKITHSKSYLCKFAQVSFRALIAFQNDGQQKNTMPYLSSLKLDDSHEFSCFSKMLFEQNIAQANFNFRTGQTCPDKRKNMNFLNKSVPKIFAELVEKIIVFKDKTVTLVLKIDKDLNSYFDKKSIDLSNFTLILPPKSLKFEESVKEAFLSFLEDSGSLFQFSGSVEKHLNVKTKKTLKKAAFIVLF